jgi:MarR family 2-MHQ and catechol resistance regulon transcriptional repressor
MFGVSDPDIETAVGTYVKLLRAARSVAARVEKLLVNEGLTMTQLGVLEAVLHKGPLTHRELGRKVLTSAANMTDVVNKLEARGLVARLRCPADHRLVHVKLTSCGQALIERVFPLHAADIAQAMAGLDTPGLARLGIELRTLGMAAAQPVQESIVAPAAE